MPGETREDIGAVYEGRCAATRELNQQLLDDLNRMRDTRRLPPLFYDGDLMRAAQYHANRMAGRGELSHGRDQTSGPSDRLKSLGIVRRYVAENIARFVHRRDPGEYVLRYWAGGDQERRNILADRYFRAGAALVPAGEYCYAVLILTD